MPRLYRREHFFERSSRKCTILSAGHEATARRAAHVVVPPLSNGSWTAANSGHYIYGLLQSRYISRASRRRRSHESSRHGDNATIIIIMKQSFLFEQSQIKTCGNVKIFLRHSKHKFHQEFVGFVIYTAECNARFKGSPAHVVFLKQQKYIGRRGKPDIISGAGRSIVL